MKYLVFLILLLPALCFGGQGMGPGPGMTHQSTDLSTFESDNYNNWSGGGGNGFWTTSSAYAAPGGGSYCLYLFLPPATGVTQTTSKTITTSAGYLDFWYKNSTTGHRMTVTINGTPTLLPETSNVWTHSTTMVVSAVINNVISFSGASDSGTSLGYYLDSVSIPLP